MPKVTNKGLSDARQPWQRLPTVPISVFLYARVSKNENPSLVVHSQKAAVTLPKQISKTL
jgi:hypothetical protein